MFEKYIYNATGIPKANDCSQQVYPEKSLSELLSQSVRPLALGLCPAEHDWFEPGLNPLLFICTDHLYRMKSLLLSCKYQVSTYKMGLTQKRAEVWGNGFLLEKRKVNKVDIKEVYRYRSTNQASILILRTNIEGFPYTVYAV